MTSFSEWWEAEEVFMRAEGADDEIILGAMRNIAATAWDAALEAVATEVSERGPSNSIYQRYEPFGFRLRPCPFCGGFGDFKIERARLTCVVSIECMSCNSAIGYQKAYFYERRGGAAYYVRCEQEFKAALMQVAEFWNTRSPKS